MASIQISNLRSAGSDLLFDSESFLNNLNEQELENTVGGSSPLCVAFVAGFAAGFASSLIIPILAGIHRG